MNIIASKAAAGICVLFAITSIITSCSKKSASLSDPRAIMQSNRVRTAEEDVKFKTMVANIMASHSYKRHIANAMKVQRMGALMEINMANYDSVKCRSCIMTMDREACLLLAGATGKVKEYAMATDSMMIYFNRMQQEFPYMYRLSSEDWQEILIAPLTINYEQDIQPLLWAGFHQKSKIKMP